MKRNFRLQYGEKSISIDFSDSLTVAQMLTAIEMAASALLVNERISQLEVEVKSMAGNWGFELSGCTSGDYEGRGTTP